jgi:ribosomal protein S18 acetylase RimI-like enzyme
MLEESLNQYICLKNKIEEIDYNRIKFLEKLCTTQDKINLKLELEYKLTIKKSNSSPIKAVYEFLYYEDGKLIGYLGVSNFVGCEAEINGMVHPAWRRKGIFTRLWSLAKDECKRRGYDKILLLCDEKSESAKGFIQSVGAKYDFSEYKMKLEKSAKCVEGQKLSVRKAKNYDGKEIGKMNSIFFSDPEVYISYPEEEEKNNRITYLFELQGKAIGKITLEIAEDAAYIYGFGIIPEHRGNGYGREALVATLDIINTMNITNVYLDVATQNRRALNLYKSCGFVEKSVMNYYSNS